MSAPRLYDITSREIDPVRELLKSIVEVNWHLSAALDQGWNVTLDISADTGQLCVTVARSECWPSLESETMEAEA